MTTVSLPQAGEGFRLSPRQDRIWRLLEMYPKFGFGAQCVVKLPGPLDRVRLREAIYRAGRRFEILRTAFAVLDGTSVPIQVISDVTPALHEVAAPAPPDEQHPIRFACAEDSPHEHTLTITASPLCADARSLSNLVHAIHSEYTGSSEPDETLQYADIAEWQNQLIEQAAGDEAARYWNSKDFAGSLFPRLPFELRNARRNSTVATLCRGIPDSSRARMEDLARKLNADVETILLAAWHTLLHRFSGADRVLTGVLLDGRSQPELRDVVGALSTPMPFLASFAGNPALVDVVRDTVAAWDIAAADQFLFKGQSFGAPTERRHLFPILFCARRLPLLQDWHIVRLEQRSEPFDLELSATIGTGGVMLEFAFNDSAFDRRDIQILSASYAALLDEIGSAPHQRVADLRMIAADSAESMIETVNPLAGQGILDTIETQIRSVPNCLAAVCGGDRITYGELGDKASALVRRLRQLGAGPDKVVALVAERSIDFLVGILAIIKSGAAWLPIEPDTPEERIAFMLERSTAVAILAQAKALERLSAATLPIARFDAGESEPSDCLRPAIDSRNLAYVIFTSGSTGEPKGVAIEHRHIAAYVNGLRNRINLDGISQFALVSTLAADLGYTSLFAALTSGGCIHMVPPSITADADALARYFAAQAIDFVKIVPAHLEAVLQCLPPKIELPWRYLFLGGELLTPRLVESIQRLAPRCAVVNHYGPTETTVGVFSGPAEPNSERFEASSIPIGRPFSSVRAYILDAQFRPVPVWMPGDLYIGGDSVARGYLQRGDLTAERFVPDPFCVLAGSRMYRTGDVARLRSDGATEFLGRNDGQVKIRGYRVELAEIEIALCSHSDVRNAAVAIGDDSVRGKHIIAWLACGASRLTVADLRAFLERKLPPYMIPAVFVCVDRLKLTPNGKVDRRNLPAPISETSAAEHVEAMDDIEERLIAVWQKVLGSSAIGVEDSYFALGGDSLRVIQLVQEARRYGIELSATDILQHQSIRNLRRVLQKKARQSLFPDGVPPLPYLCSRDGLVDCYPATGIQLYMFEAAAVKPGAYHIQDCYRVEDPGFSLEALEGAFRTVVDRHPALRTTFDLDSIPPMQQVHPALAWRIEVEDISHLPSEAQEHFIDDYLAADLKRPFDIRNGSVPLFRVAVFVRAHPAFNLMFSCHHAILDGWSHRLLLNQLIEAYSAIKAGRAPELGAPDASCRELATFQYWVARAGQAAQFWREYLEGAHAAPFRPRESEARPCDSSSIRLLDASLTARLLEAARQHALSMQALMLAAWLKTLRTLCAEGTLITGVVMNGRSEHLNDPLSAVGLFWNLIPVVSRADLPTLEQAHVVQRDLVAMQPYTAYPFKQLIADRGGDELFFTTFRYLNFWNTKKVPNESGIQLAELRTYDRYSYPLCASAVIEPFGEEGYLQMEFDEAAVSSSRVESAMAHYVALLEQIAQTR